MRSQQYKDGQRSALKWAVEWFHKQANRMDDPQAKAIMNQTAFELGVAKKEFLRKSEEKDSG